MVSYNNVFMELKETKNSLNSARIIKEIAWIFSMDISGNFDVLFET